MVSNIANPNTLHCPQPPGPPPRPGLVWNTKTCRWIRQEQQQIAVLPAKSSPIYTRQLSSSQYDARKAMQLQGKLREELGQDDEKFIQAHSEYIAKQAHFRNIQKEIVGAIRQRIQDIKLLRTKSRQQFQNSNQPGSGSPFNNVDQRGMIQGMSQKQLTDNGDIILKRTQPNPNGSSKLDPSQTNAHMAAKFMPTHTTRLQGFLNALSAHKLTSMAAREGKMDDFKLSRHEAYMGFVDAVFLRDGIFEPMEDVHAPTIALVLDPKVLSGRGVVSMPSDAWNFKDGKHPWGALEQNLYPSGMVGESGPDYRDLVNMHYAERILSYADGQQDYAVPDNIDTFHIKAVIVRNSIKSRFPEARVKQLLPWATIHYEDNLNDGYDSYIRKK